jgi:hypothetical protein
MRKQITLRRCQLFINKMNKLLKPDYQYKKDYHVLRSVEIRLWRNLNEKGESFIDLHEWHTLSGNTEIVKFKI